MKRASELQSAVTDWSKRGHGVVSLLTLTVRHRGHHDLRKLRAGLSRAKRRLFQGKTGQKLRRLLHLKHHVRGLEPTHGDKNGWHPHLHLLVFSLGKPEPEALDYLKERWAEAVEKELGKEHVPDWEHGADLRPATSARYLEKMGLEVTHSFTKRAGKTSRTPWEIAQDAASGDAASAKLWRSYCRSMKGARQLTWSRGARRFFGLGLRDSDAAVVESDDASEGELLAEWDGLSWDACLRFDPFWVARVAHLDAPGLEHLRRRLRGSVVVRDPWSVVAPPNRGAA